MEWKDKKMMKKNGAFCAFGSQSMCMHQICINAPISSDGIVDGKLVLAVEISNFIGH